MSAVLVTLAGGFSSVLAGANSFAAAALAFTADLLGAFFGVGLASTFLVTGFAAGFGFGFFAAGLAGDLTAFLAGAFTTVLPPLFSVLLPTAVAGFFALVFFAGVLLTKVSSQR